MKVLLLDLDTLRPDHLGCYGYGRNTSPNIDSVAKEGMRFDQYFCSDAPCLPSRSALMSGMFGIHNGVVGHGGTAADQKLEGEQRGFRSHYSNYCLPNLFREANFKTVSISTFAERHSAFWFYSGFHEIYNVGKGGLESAEEVTPVTLDWIARNRNTENWFLHVNYWDAHTPYRTPEAYYNPFLDCPLDTWMTEELIAKHRKDVGPHSAREVNMFDNKINPNFPQQLGEVRNMEDYKLLVDGYDSGIAYMDRNIGILFETLKKEGMWDDLAIIITSDHGENLGELNSYSEHATADYSTCRIPMIIKWPGCKAGTSDANLHYNVDLAPTIADILKTPASPNWDGESYSETLFFGKEQKRQFIVLSQCAHVCQRSVIFDDYLYIRTYHDGFHLYEKEMLFQIKDDPQEQHDLSKENGSLCERGAAYLLEWHDKMMETSTDATDPMLTVLLEGGPFHAKGNLNRYCDHLMRTGRELQAAKLQQKYGKKEITF